MRMRLLAATVAVLMLGGTGTALAKGATSPNGSPGPNGHNDHGLCNAYSNGSPMGQANKQAHGQAFIGLAAAAAAYDASQDAKQAEGPTGDSDTQNEEVADYCAANG